MLIVVLDIATNANSTAAKMQWLLHYLLPFLMIYTGHQNEVIPKIGSTIDKNGNCCQLVGP